MLFGNKGGNFPAGPQDVELPFRVKVGEYYLINPSEESTDPFWIGLCCAVGIDTCHLLFLLLCSFIT